MENNNKLIATTYQTNFADLVIKTMPLVGGNKMEAEDIVQDVFVAQCSNCKYEGKDNASMETYLFTIIKHKVYDKYRNSKNYKYVPFDEENENNLPFDNYFETIEEEQEKTKQINKMMSAVGDLNEKQAQAIDMFFFQNKNQKEIAHELGITTGAVEQLIYRAKANIKQSMQAA